MDLGFELGADTILLDLLVGVQMWCVAAR